MKTLFLAFIVFAITSPIVSAQAFDHSHQEFGAVLREFVHQEVNRTVVDYASLKERPEVLDQYLLSLQKISREEFDAFNRDQQLAFLINAYNGFTLKLIISNYPISSIRKIGGITGPWKVRFFDLLGERKHLDDIEHNMIRKMFNEPRIHFAVNCASRGCPNLAQTPYEASALDAQLEAAARTFLSDSTLNRLSIDDKRLEVSSIFNWFKKDFASASGSLQKFLVQYVPLTQEQKTKVLSGETALEYLDYDWSLNEPNRD